MHLEPWNLCFYLKIGRLNDFICFLKLKIVIDSNFNALVSVNLKIALLCCLFASASCFVPIAKLQSNLLDKLRFCYLAVQIWYYANFVIPINILPSAQKSGTNSKYRQVTCTAVAALVFADGTMFWANLALLVNIL